MLKRILTLWCISAIFTLAYANPIKTDLTISHIQNDKWLLDYVFERPINRLDFGPARGNFRQQSWKILTKHVKLQGSENTEFLEIEQDGISHLQIELQAYTEFPQGAYAPMAIFSDGGKAIFLPYLIGSLRVQQESTTMQIKLHFNKLANENLIASEINPERGYVYFGHGDVQSRSYGNVLIDQAIPEWARNNLEQVLDKLTSYYPISLAHPLRRKLPILFAITPHAGESFSLKGGAVSGQIVFRLSGSKINEDSEINRTMLQQVIAHELAHIWQSDIIGGGFNPKQNWLHEGGAEMMAIAALQETDIWTQDQKIRWEQKLINECTQLKNNLQSYRGPYACGFQILQSKHLPYLPMWRQLIQIADQLGMPYNDEMLQSLKTPIQN